MEFFDTTKIFDIKIMEFFAISTYVITEALLKFMNSITCPTTKLENVICHKSQFLWLYKSIQRLKTRGFLQNDPVSEV